MKKRGVFGLTLIILGMVLIILGIFGCSHLSVCFGGGDACQINRLTTIKNCMIYTDIISLVLIILGLILFKTKKIILGPKNH